MKQPKPKKCKCCKELFKPTNTLQIVCSLPCALKLMPELNRLKQAKEAKVQKDILKENVKGIGGYRTDLQKELNHIARLIDANCNCISCGYLTDAVDGGHYRSVSSDNSLRWHLMNIFLQCKRCNDPKRKGGNSAGYVDGLIKNFGRDIFEQIIDLKVQYPFIKLDIVTLKEKIAIARQIVKELKEANQVDSLPRKTDLRIELRVKFNKLLGIYL
jgi:5-methylcytosine-specific restriction endonuclease McrA